MRFAAGVLLTSGRSLAIPRTFNLGHSRNSTQVCNDVQGSENNSYPKQRKRRCRRTPTHKSQASASHMQHRTLTPTSGGVAGESLLAAVQNRNSYSFSTEAYNRGHNKTIKVCIVHAAPQAILSCSQTFVGAHSPTSVVEPLRKAGRLILLPKTINKSSIGHVTAASLPKSMAPQNRRRNTAKPQSAQKN